MPLVEFDIRELNYEKPFVNEPPNSRMSNETKDVYLHCNSCPRVDSDPSTIAVLYIWHHMDACDAKECRYINIERQFQSVGNGLASTTIPMYLAECAPAHIRGRLVSTNIAMVACGQFVANLVDGIFGWDQADGWRYMLGLSGIPAFIQFIGFLFMPESPRWLIIKGREEKARRCLQLMRGSLDIEEEYENIKQTCRDSQREQSKTRKPIIVQMLQIPPVRRALIVGCSLQVVQQIAGINTVMYYSATIIKMSGVKNDEKAIWLSAVTAAVNFIFTLIGLYLVEKIGRRPLTLASLLGAIVSLAWLALGFQLAASNSPPVSFIEKIAEESKCAKYALHFGLNTPVTFHIPQRVDV